ncbi:hypothetical protein [Streptococcus sp. CSL10205-OR2]|uniref:hypothetical protein n=1 Tax=Streptococcus sp. CSL10205-OR2 TaxID=2980558 RepID=UPI0021DA877E|nr:hypothetical protein [Streptococcus sp. CSL10205-OR2]MCU9533528.1 hypothetical protein [Streptococcus sp. CSL10205-OR2]
MSRSQSHFFRGNFLDALKLLEEIDLTALEKRPTYKLAYELLWTLSMIMSDQVFDFQAVINRVKSVEADQATIEKVVNELEAVRDIMLLKKENSFFEEAIPNSNLKKVYYDFYKSQNRLLSGNKVSGKETFQELAQGNSDLFMVRYAKDYLKGNNESVK